MAAIDYERVLLRLKEHVCSKRSHGMDELLVTIAQLEVECQVPEGQEGFDATPLRPRAVSPTRERHAAHAAGGS